MTLKIKQINKKAPNPWWALALLCTSFFMVVTDSTSVYSALPSIQESLHFSWGGPAWVIIIYMLTFAGLVLLGGRIADYFGRRRMFTLGVVFFTLSATLCGFSWNGEVLIFARLIQGVSAAIMTPAALSIVINTFKKERERNKAIGIWGAMGGIGATGGLLIGGPTTEFLGWEWIFFVNVPMGIIVLVFTPFLLKESNDRTISKFDIPGAILVTCFLLMIAYLITGIPEQGWASSQSLSLLFGSLLVLFLFIRVEKNSKSPLVPFRIFQSSPLVGGNLLILLAGMSVDGMLYTFTLFVQQLLGYTALQFGLTMTAMTVLSVVGVYAGQHLVTQTGLRKVGMSGMALLGAGMVLILILPVAQHTWMMLIALSVFGIGMGASFVTAQIAALSYINEADSGLASGIVETSFSVGGALGIAVMATVSQLYSGNPDSDVLTHTGVYTSFYVIVGLSVIGMVISYFYFKGISSPLLSES
ncbi:MFS transporter [Algoriphagus sp.]|uniref:MFS transporter n=1 Tax=Algoriphagus sp. TaxID=1872435 RepID=UPI003F71DE8A